MRKQIKCDNPTTWNTSEGEKISVQEGLPMLMKAEKPKFDHKLLMTRLLHGNRSSRLNTFLK